MLSFTALEEMNHHLEHHKYPYLLVYFTAKWNPVCKVSDQHVNEIRLAFPHVAVATVSSDAAPDIAKHYLVKAEPEFIFCRQGDEVVRQVGISKEGLFDKTNRMLKGGEGDEEWQPYGTTFDSFYKRSHSRKRWWWFW